MTMDPFQKKAYIILACVVSYLLLVLAWVGASLYARKQAEKEIKALERQYNISLPHGNINIKNPARIEIEDMAVVREGSDTLFSAGLLKVRLSPLRAEVTGIEVMDFACQTSGLSPKDVADNHYALRTEQYLNLLYNILPRRLSVQNVRIHHSYKGKPLLLDIRRLHIRNSRFSADIKTLYDGSPGEWEARGAFLEEEQKIDLRLHAKKGHTITLPCTGEKYGTSLQFDTLAIEVQSVTKAPGVITLQGKGGVKGLALFNEHLAADTVRLAMGYAYFLIHIGANYVEVDNRTSLLCNRLKINPYVRIEKNADWHVTASVDKTDFPAAELFESIPKGLFRHVEGLQAEGSLTYHLALDVDMARVEKLTFSSTLDARDFRILTYGNTDFRMMNEPFTHTIQREGKPVRTFVLGDENPGFRPYKSISRYLPYAIMHAEDAEFFTHGGFLPDAFRRSLIENLKERRFARGGSTLSMQVVKNIFLSSDKTIARKLEEIGIVWLIETNRLVSKQRMFEVYMNVIEWGPDVYGITEAARFYFGKDPSALTLTECVFLAYILPDPRHVKEHFSGWQIEPAFRPFHYDAVKRIYQRHWISGRERATSTPSLRITGPAVQYLTGND